MSKIQQSIIAHILLKNDYEKQNEIISQLIPDFFDGKNKEVFEKLKEKINRGVAVDPISFWNNDLDYITQCMTCSGMINSIKGAFLELKEEYKQREIKKLTEIKNPADIKIKLREIEEKSELLDPQELPSLGEILAETILSQSENPIDLNKMAKTGFIEFDEFYRGFMPGKLITIGGYSSVGKSTLIFSLIKNLGFDYKILIFNLEMETADLNSRLLAGLSGVPFEYTWCLGDTKTQENIDKYGLREKLNKGLTLIDELKVVSSDKDFRLEQILNRIRKEAKKGLDFVLIDYLQLITARDPKMQRYLQVAEITRELKIIAKELKITVVILAQLGRSSLSKDEPELNDLRESGSIEQDSDDVFLIFKKENNDRYLKLAKNRMFGKFGIAKLNYNVKTQAYE
jgi:replicative DNA helicase